jgi:hypothetical protein
MVLRKEKQKNERQPTFIPSLRSFYLVVLIQAAELESQDSCQGIYRIRIEIHSYILHDAQHVQQPTVMIR